MKRGDLVFSRKHGDVRLVCDTVGHDSTIAIVAVAIRQDANTTPDPQRAGPPRPVLGPAVRFEIMNEEDAVPVTFPAPLDDLRQWLTTGRKP